MARELEGLRDGGMVSDDCLYGSRRLLADTTREPPFANVDDDSPVGIKEPGPAYCLFLAGFDAAFLSGAGACGRSFHFIIIV